MKLLKKTKWFAIIVALLLIIQIGFYLHATTSPMWKYAKKTFGCWSANYDLRYCEDLPSSARVNYTNSSWKPLPCINTASSFYNDTHRVGNCNVFMANPGKWGFREVSEDEAVPGDMMLFLRKEDGARHAGIYTMNSLLGPLCANTITTGLFLHFLPIKPLLIVHAVGFYKVRYYRYMGGQ